MSKKKKGKNKTKNVHPADLMPISTMSITRYTYDTWMKCYPESNEEEWECRSTPNSVLDFLSSQMYLHEKMFGHAHREIPTRITVLDDEYFKWLGDRENTTTERTNYASYVSDEDALRIAKKHGMHYSYTVCLYPVFLLPEESAISRRRVLSTETRTSFANYIKQIMPDLDIYVAPYCMEMLHATSQEDELIAMARSYFETGEEIEHRSWMRVYNENPYNLTIYGIPVIFRETHDTMRFIPENLFDEEHELVRGMDDMAMTQEYFDDFGVKGVIPFEETDLPASIQKDLKITWPLDAFSDYFVAVWDVDEYYQDMEDGVFNEDEDDVVPAKRHGVSRYQIGKR